MVTGVREPEAKGSVHSAPPVMVENADISTVRSNPPSWEWLCETMTNPALSRRASAHSNAVMRVVDAGSRFPVGSSQSTSDGSCSNARQMRALEARHRMERMVAESAAKGESGDDSVPMLPPPNREYERRMTAVQALVEGDAEKVAQVVRKWVRESE